MGIVRRVTRAALECLADRHEPAEAESAADPRRAPCPRCGAPASRRIVASFGKRRPITCGQCGASLGVEE